MPPWGADARAKIHKYKKQKCTAVPHDIAEPWLARLTAVESTMQGLINQDILDGKYRKTMKFSRGDPILVLSSRGLYFSGTIRCCCRAVAPESLAGQDASVTDIPVQTLVPTYLVRFHGYGIQYDEEFPENEIISPKTEYIADVLGMLYAHEWNTYQRMHYNCEDSEMGLGTWFLTDENYAALEQEWKMITGTAESFAHISGRETAEAALAADQSRVKAVLLGTGERQ